MFFGLGVLHVVSGCSRDASNRDDIARPVQTIVVSTWSDVRVRTFPGKVEASKKAELAFQVSGLLVQLPIKEAQKVAKGDVIAQVREDEFRARLQVLQGNLDKARAALKATLAGERPEEQERRRALVRTAEATLANAHTEYERNHRLVQTYTVSRQEYDRSATAVRVAEEELAAARRLLEMGTVGRQEDIAAKEAAVRSLEGSVVEAKINLDDCTLRAPYAGVIAKRFVELQQNVKAKQPIVQFQDVDEVQIAVDVPETIMAGEVLRSDIVQILAEISAAPGVHFPVYIQEMAQKADPVTQTFRVRVGMRSPPELNLLPGMTATVTLHYRRASILGGGMLVPVAAVAKNAKGEQVAWVVGTDGTATSRAVTIGGVTGNQIEIASGLEPGERIAVAGVTFLRDGMKVRDLGDSLGRSMP
jgi:RND family efflux transporter MFP subunit